MIEFLIVEYNELLDSDDDADQSRLMELEDRIVRINSGDPYDE